MTSSSSLALTRERGAMLSVWLLTLLCVTEINSIAMASLTLLRVKRPARYTILMDLYPILALQLSTYRLTRQVEAYISLTSTWGVPLACLGSS